LDEILKPVTVFSVTGFFLYPNKFKNRNFELVCVYIVEYLSLKNLSFSGVYRMERISSPETIQKVLPTIVGIPKLLNREILQFAVNSLLGEKSLNPTELDQHFIDLSQAKEIFRYTAAASTGAIAYKQLTRHRLIHNPLLRILFAGLAGAGGFALSKLIAPPSVASTSSNSPPTSGAPPPNDDPKSKYPQLFTEPPPPYLIPSEISVTKAAGDGNCLYHSIKAWLTKNQGYCQETETLKDFEGQAPSHFQIRKRAVSVLKEKKGGAAHLLALQNARALVGLAFRNS
jgi:hypothetical protein